MTFNTINKGFVLSRLLRHVAALAGQWICSSVPQGSLLPPQGVPGRPAPAPQGDRIPDSEDPRRPFASFKRRGQTGGFDCWREVSLTKLATDHTAHCLLNTASSLSSCDVSQNHLGSNQREAFQHRSQQILTGLHRESCLLCDPGWRRTGHDGRWTRSEFGSLRQSVVAREMLRQVIRPETDHVSATAALMWRRWAFVSRITSSSRCHAGGSTSPFHLFSTRMERVD